MFVARAARLSCPESIGASIPASSLIANAAPCSSWRRSQRRSRAYYGTGTMTSPFGAGTPRPLPSANPIVLIEWGVATPHSEKNEVLNYSLGRLERRLAGKITCHIVGVAETQARYLPPLPGYSLPQNAQNGVVEMGLWAGSHRSVIQRLNGIPSEHSEAFCPLTCFLSLPFPRRVMALNRHPA